jgi:hypothetical protein
LLLPSRIAWRDEHWPTDWSSKGIVFASGRDAESDDIWMLPFDRDRTPFPLVREAGNQRLARLSPDGTWLAYVTELASGPEVIVRSLAKPDAKWRISTGGGSFPRWRRDGRELFYLAADGSLLAVPVDTDHVGILHAGVGRSLFRTGIRTLGGVGGEGTFNVSADGQRFLVTVPHDREPVAAPSIVVVTDWTRALTQ